MKRKRKSAHSNRFAIQRLETRQLLAADIGPLDQLLQPPVDLTPQAVVQQHADRQAGSQSTGESSPVEFRSIDGSGNNLQNPEFGSTHIQLLRAAAAEYADGVSDPAGTDRPSARKISNVVAAQTTTQTNDRLLTDIVWLWGQFIDHDIDLTENADPAESFNIDVPAGDIFFDPEGSGDDVISLNRSNFDTDTGTSADNVRQQINEITAFLDGSVIYGSDEVRAAELREGVGGRLKTSEGNLLPFNTAGLANAGGTSDSLFLAGDIRANENAALIAMHTLWVREHNFWAERLATEDPSLSDEQLYQQAKAIVTGELQAITFNEFLPALLGENAISEYAGYQSSVNPGIANVFSTSAYRFGHSMLPTELLRLNNDGTIADEGNLPLQNAFFAIGEITGNGIESLLLGATEQLANEIDTQVVDDIRNFLFGPPGAGGFDLASLNIQRGRDHGLADYNDVREAYGLDRVTDFSEITSDTELAAKLQQLYGTVDNIDAWVGGLAEDHVPGSSLGELNHTIIADQFQRLRDGDRFWYQNVFSGRQLRMIENTSLADVIQRNTDIEGLRDNLFFDASVSEDNGNDRHDRNRRDRNHRVARQSNDRINDRQLDGQDQVQRSRLQASQLAASLAGSTDTSTAPNNQQRDRAFATFGNDGGSADRVLAGDSALDSGANKSRGQQNGGRGSRRG